MYMYVAVLLVSLNILDWARSRTITFVRCMHTAPFVQILCETIRFIHVNADDLHGQAGLSRWSLCACQAAKKADLWRERC